MTVFACAGCGAALTAPVSRVALPVHARHRCGHELLPALMDPGTFAVDPEPSGPPWRPWEEIGTDEAEARGVYAPVPALSDGPPGSVVIAPGDVRGTVLIPGRCDGYCLGLDGGDGANLACAGCGSAVATRIDDCSFWQAIWLAPEAVRPLPEEGPAPPIAGWTELMDEHPGVPPVEPPGHWSPLWEAAFGDALARLLAVTEGAPVSVPDGPVADVLRRPLDALLPAGPRPKALALAGPGLDPPGGGIALVPRHPQTGDAWEPAGPAEAVPLEFRVWRSLAFGDGRIPVPVTGGLPEGVHRDESPPLLPVWRFSPDWWVFIDTLARLPEVRRPWLRRIHDHVRARRFEYPPPC
ncbi:hypothetical protein [Actinomadura sp. WMMB 499]|uniref:hypothetical protein n=1 Tax=Actinomadura sp. WMMB 499 TaxID=1219491 RepID=UPI001246744D|nr:hypothetical protein [Actinomadura sp. WMMB 499]QFG20559.1 hypothetical protein F7P10_04735 [Actinomadura sp. WMMB 499]